MVDVRNKRCDVDGCEKSRSHGFERNKPLVCATHSKPGMENVVSPKCQECGLFIAKKKTCSYCRPDCKRERTREYTIVNLVRDHLPDYSFSHNQSIGFSCGAFRPDILYHRPTHDVILEIDEDQHSGYDAGCEYARMINIVQTFGRPCVFVRYNPDVFRRGGEKVRISKTHRHAILIAELKKCLDASPKKLLEVVYLFYDNHEIRHDTPILPTGM